MWENREKYDKCHIDKEEEFNIYNYLKNDDVSVNLQQINTQVTFTFDNIKAVPHTHTGGTATCTAAAVCTRCKTSYGNKNANNHSGSSTYGGTSGVHTKYSCCGVTISSSHSITVNTGVKYSDATCTAKQKNYKSCVCGYNPKSTSYLVEVGSALGHTGGTIDKLESIEGYNTSIDTDAFFKQVNEIGIALIGQTGNLAPADKKIYALRDVTATVGNISLIASSIMSKKIAAGAKNIVLDVKCGSGAFMKDEKSATELAEMMVKIGKKCGRNMAAVITNMDIPLGSNIGNALEIKEVVDILKNKGDKQLRELCLVLSATILSISHGWNYDVAYNKAENALLDGSAFDKLKELVTAQGGNAEMLDNTELLPSCEKSLEIKAKQDGYIQSIDSRIVGESAVLLGAGREKKTDTIDYGAGIVLIKKTCDKVSIGDTIAVLYAETEERLKNAEKLFNTSFTIGVEKPELMPLVYKTIK